LTISKVLHGKLLWQITQALVSSNVIASHSCQVVSFLPHLTPKKIQELKKNGSHPFTIGYAVNHEALRMN